MLYANMCKLSEGKVTGSKAISPMLIYPQTFPIFLTVIFYVPECFQ